MKDLASIEEFIVEFHCVTFIYLLKIIQECPVDLDTVALYIRCVKV